VVTVLTRCPAPSVAKKAASTASFSASQIPLGGSWVRSVFFYCNSVQFNRNYRLSVSHEIGDIDFNLSRLLGAELVACRFRNTESGAHWMRLHYTVILLLALIGSVYGFNKFLRRQNHFKNSIMSTTTIHTVRLQHPGTCSGSVFHCSVLETRTELTLDVTFR
jgi:hypothetical protein